MSCDTVQAAAERRSAAGDRIGPALTGFRAAFGRQLRWRLHGSAASRFPAPQQSYRHTSSFLRCEREDSNLHSG
jgi:hypothetical protein